MALVRSPGLFLLGAMGECLGSGFPAAIQSVALEIYRRSVAGAGSGGDKGKGEGKGEGKVDETGKLFAALSVMQSVGWVLFTFLILSISQNDTHLTSLSPAPKS
jgi:hypothetical protein